VTFTEIVQAIAEETNYTGLPQSAVLARLKRVVNEGVRAILSEPGLGRLADSDAPFAVASVASQARYVIPEAVAKIHGISERTNDMALRAFSQTTYRHAEPDPTSVTGTPTHYVPFGRVAVAVQPSDASEIFVKSTSASDVFTAYIEGVTTGGYQRVALKTMTGVTAVSLDTTITSFIEITDFYLSANAVGTITLHEDSGAGTELARITIGQKRPRYYAFALWPTPSAVVSYLVDYRREMVDMTQDTDEPPLPTDYHPILVAYGVKREAEKTGNVDLLTVAEARYQKLLSRLKYATQTTPDDLPVAGRGRLYGHSRLGGWFPADVYTRG
jgi:hypothetical protein